MNSLKDSVLEYLRRRRVKEIDIEEIIEEIASENGQVVEKDEVVEVLQELESSDLLELVKDGSQLLVQKKTTQEIIISHLLKNRGREIPVSEIVEKYDLKRNVISNAIKALEYKGKIESKSFRKKGQFTVLKLTSDRVIKPYTKRKPTEKKIKHVAGNKIGTDLLDDHIQYLLSEEFTDRVFLEMTEKLSNNPFDFVVNYLTPLMRRVGDLWADKELITGEEHVITSRMKKLLFELISAKDSGRKEGELIFLVPVESDYHTLALLSIEFILTDLPYKVTNLGKPLPAEFLINYIRESTVPSWIFLSMTLPAYKGTLKRELGSLREVFGSSVKIAIGGQGLTEKDRRNFPEADFIVINKQDLVHFFKQVLAIKNE